MKQISITHSSNHYRILFFILEKACNNNKWYLLVIIRHLVMHNKVAKSVRNKCENYPGQEILPVIIILNLINLYIPLSINNPPSNDYVSNRMSISASFWIDPLIASSVKSTSLNLRELLHHLIRRTVFPADAACSTSSYPSSRRTRKTSSERASQPDETHIQYALITSLRRSGIRLSATKDGCTSS